MASFYTVPPDFDFLGALAKRICAETRQDPLLMKDYTIVLPDQMSCDAFKEKLRELNDGAPIVMPEIVTLDHLDNDILSLRFAAGEGFATRILETPPAISSLQRELYLTREILKHPETANSMSAAVRLAKELASFIDELHDAGVALESLSGINDQDFPGDLVKTKNLLGIITKTWPDLKTQLGVLDTAERRQKLLSIMADYAQTQNIGRPLIFAGFSDFSQGVVDMFKSLSQTQNENIRIVFPGLDMQVGKESWAEAGPSHPQYAFKALLDQVGIDRDDVNYWPGTTESTHSRRAVERRKLLREALRPSSTTHKWKFLKAYNKNKLRPSKTVVPKGSPLAKQQTAGYREIDPIALTGLDLVIAGTPQEEASVIALKLRELLEKPDQNAVLVTPDKDLARRVSARLQHWGVQASLEGGTTLFQSKIGSWAFHVLDMAVSDLAPVPLLETLKSPYAALGQSFEDLQNTVLELENNILHGPRPWPGYGGLKKSLKSKFNAAAARTKTKARQQELEETYTHLAAWVDAFENNVKPYSDVFYADEKQSFKSLLTAHIQMLEVLAETPEETGAQRLWVGQDGKALHKVFKDLLRNADIMPPMSGLDYAQFIKTILQTQNVQAQQHPRIRILDPKSAALISADLKIVAGLTSNHWPGKHVEKFWLSPKIRRDLGLPPLDAKIGQAAHQFIYAASGKYTLMTRSERDQNAPTLPSPFVTRLAMLLRGLGLEDKLAPRTKVLDMNAALHAPAQVQPVEPPRPTPPVKARPKKLSVSAIEMLLRDPYAVYARYVLKLNPKASIDAPPSFAERGHIIHDALDAFKAKYPTTLPENAYEELIKYGQEAFGRRMESPSVQAFWWPRFERMARWFVEYETARQGLAKTLKTEVPGKLKIETENGRFILTAVADRIDALMDDSLSIIDYKTGSVPSKKDVQSGLSPQLTLEALIALSGGFKGIDAKDVGLLEYWKLSGGRPAGKVIQYDHVEDLQVQALEGLTRLITHFNNEENPYLPTPRVKAAPRYIPYNHLGRSDEWGADTSKGQAGGRARPKGRSNQAKRFNKRRK